MILGVIYAERQSLDLRRTGSVDVDKAGRERLGETVITSKEEPKEPTKERPEFNVKTSCVAVASIDVPSSKKHIVVG